MLANPKKLITLAFVAQLLCIGVIAQAQSKRTTQELFAALREDEKLVAVCEQKLGEEQIAKYGRVLPKVSGHCLDGCPTRLVLPVYPNEAKRLNFSGQVKVEAIVDETGKVVYARAMTGKPLLRQAAEQAALDSSYQPKKTCSNKPIKFRWLITYNFILN